MEVKHTRMAALEADLAKQNTRQRPDQNEFRTRRGAHGPMAGRVNYTLFGEGCIRTDAPF